MHKMARPAFKFHLQSSASVELRVKTSGCLTSDHGRLGLVWPGGPFRASLSLLHTLI